MDNTEKELLTNYRRTKEKLDQMNTFKTEAQKAFDLAKYKLIEFMQDGEIDRTATYEGIGYFSLNKEEKLRSYCIKEHEAQLFELMENEGFKSLIKPSVHWANLDEFTKYLLEKGKTIPEWLRYNFERTGKFYTK